MSAERKAPVRCAVYTRKSSEEGLEQSFNSLDAQRGSSLWIDATADKIPVWDKTE